MLPTLVRVPAWHAGRAGCRGICCICGRIVGDSRRRRIISEGPRGRCVTVGGKTHHFDCRDRVLKMDGRAPHCVVKSSFRGERFAVIWYKSYDERITAPTPILTTPHFVY